NLSQLLRELQLAFGLEIDTEASFLHCDSLFHIGIYDRFLDLILAGELQAQRRLRVLALAAEQSVGVLEQSTLEEQERAVRLEGLDDGHVLALKQKARLAPLQVFLEPTIEEERSQFLDFALPRFGSVHERINFGVLLTHDL